MKLIDYESGREDFMAVVYDELRADPDNLRANRIIDAMDAIPTIDAVPVVRCSECIFADEIPKHKAHLIVEGYLTCSLGRGDDTYNLSVVWPTEYCSEGTRKEEPT